MDTSTLPATGDLMAWKNDQEARRRSNQNYDATYRKNRAERMRLAQWRCEIRTPGICIGAASECDHIIAVIDGGGPGVDNLRAACKPCHKARTAQQGGGYRTPGQPLVDPEPRPSTQWGGDLGPQPSRRRQ